MAYSSKKVVKDRTAFGFRLHMLRAQAGLTQSELAELLGISIRFISRYETGKTVPSAENMKRYARTLGVPREWLEGDAPLETPTQNKSFNGNQTSLPGSHLELLGTARPGNPIPIIEIEDVTEVNIADVIPEGLVKGTTSTELIGAHLVAVKIKDDSMAPKISPGDVVVVNRSLEPAPGDTAVVVVDGKAMLRKVVYAGDHVVLTASNAEPLTVLASDLEVFGKAVEAKVKL